MSEVMMIIIGMTIVTYIPRLIPFLIINGKPLPNKLRQFLNYVPYTALGALIIPSAIDAIPNKPIVSIVGLSFAACYSYVKGGIIITVIGTIGIVYLLLLLNF